MRQVRASAVDQWQVEPKREVQWCLLDPIEIEEVRQSLLGINSQTAAGPDGHKLSDVKRIPVVELALLFNKWLYTSVLLTALWEGCTTLIPNEANRPNFIQLEFPPFLYAFTTGL